MKDLPIHIIASFLTLILSISLLLQPSHVIGTETPLRELPMMPPSTAQTQLPPLPIQTETRDQQGNRVMTIRDVEMLIAATIPRDATDEEREGLRGYITGYRTAILNPDVAEKYLQKFLAENYTGDVSESKRVGFVIGVDEGLSVRELIRDTLDAIGVPRIPDTQPKLPHIPPTTPKTPTGPDTPL
jgi:hypothetical protein